MLSGTWSQAHAYDPSDYMETRLYGSVAEWLSHEVGTQEIGVRSPDVGSLQNANIHRRVF